jgi:hypothetical protein
MVSDLIYYVKYNIYILFFFWKWSSFPILCVCVLFSVLLLLYLCSKQKKITLSEPQVKVDLKRDGKRKKKRKKETVKCYTYDKRTKYDTYNKCDDQKKTQDSWSIDIIISSINTTINHPSYNYY